jgi:phosphoglycerol transferase
VDTQSPAKAYDDRPRSFGDERDGFVAADHMAAEFLQWLTAQDFYEDTTVFVFGDHLYMDDDLGPVPLAKDRSPSLYNVFLNTVLDEDRKKPMRTAVMWDMGPSLLQSIGVELPDGRFGLGVSIFQDELTLAERYGAGTLKTFTQGRSLFYEKFFQPPELLADTAASAGSSLPN